MTGNWFLLLFFGPYDIYVEPYIRVAVGDYKELLKTEQKDDVLAGYLCSIAHELTHYFQWINKNLKGSFTMAKKIQRGILLILILWGMTERRVYADSSWIWLSKRQPYEIMPVVAVITILIEVLIILHFLKITETKRGVLIIFGGNLASFLVPYIVNYMLLKTQMGYENIERAFSIGPYYIVGLGYLFLTIVIELPIVYAGLKNEIKDKKKGIFVICAANVITTAFVFGVERILCYGRW